MPRKYYKAAKMARKSRLSKAFNALKSQVSKNTATLKQTVEDKQTYIETSQSLPDNSFTHIDAFSGLAQGVADTGTGTTTATGARIGNSINLKSMSMRFVLDGTKYGATAPNPAAKSGGMHRVIIYNSPCGEDLVASDILREGASAFVSLRSHYQTRIAQGKMYQIWYDKIHVLSDAKPASVFNFVKRWKKGKKVLYDDNTLDPSNFHPKILVVSYNVPPGSNNDFSYSLKAKYEDL